MISQAKSVWIFDLRQFIGPGVQPLIFSSRTVGRLDSSKASSAKTYDSILVGVSRGGITETICYMNYLNLDQFESVKDSLGLYLKGFIVHIARAVFPIR